MSNNRTRKDYIICMCTRCTVSNPSGKRQRKQNAKRHYKQYGAPVLAASAMDMRNENVDRMEIDYNSDVDVDFNVNEEEDAGPQSFVIDGDDIKEGGTSFGFEKDEAFEDPALSSMKMQAHQYPLNNMPVYIRFMAIFIVIFHLVFLVDNGESILIEFCNILLSLFDLTGALPLTIDSLKHITGFNTATGGITVGNRSSPVMVYPYSSLKHALQQHFLTPNFEYRINLWRNRQTLAETKMDIYNGAMWNEIKDNNGKRFVDDA
ncbi:hypothetical protein PHYBLDRAFT_149558 [Phycomyces blakesleeanus NRRL 1555(-)]|uniref:Uncharacterized protein n=1 Tax=Phycomyces blakesleeanus (strain ATCC 8743b / DSM 1359 / FGSC 10004 / NBRC 33097 / NRRL 1555) TaxID=763407 RepID=A0A162WMX0_PHYB8|nr:hypothetical protein PHYBLDRAFT_149558 [Phycomyces blakesleeanus NRRL 1555(-)]OAD69155.1 hypothetical protein PHYBLDRAFT_149558 [Phycomyces blakesleeanus NRRL 1555(-)]|eukprot:XP_018287195.1 hypothetical protein PHYBLDRAFT_149558 [Phycomyces blakesleeanus NRRL 1555(-)]